MNLAPSLGIEQQTRDLIAGGQLTQAEALLRPLLCTGSGPVALWRLLLQAIRPQGKISEVRAILEMLVQTLPGDLGVRFELAEILLLQGEFGRGWREYRFRYSLEHTARMERKVQGPRWSGQPLPGQTLLIHDEQGYGDTFQFLRMVPWARRRSGARVILEVNPDSLTLAQRSGGFDDIIARGTLPPRFDMHCEMMSLPHAMGLQLSDLPGSMPYLTPDPLRLSKWRARLADLPRPLVALVWAGRPSHYNDARRSMTLADLAPLAQPGVTFLALQKGPAAAQASSAPEGMRLVSLSDDIADFEDTAAILSIADLLISVDSAPIHLAGALGRPAWVMLPFVAEWRWLLKRNDSPWYPSLRLFRQSRADDWHDVLTTMATALGALKAEMTISLSASQ